GANGVLSQKEANSQSAHGTGLGGADPSGDRRADTNRACGACSHGAGLRSTNSSGANSSGGAKPNSNGRNEGIGRGNQRTRATESKSSTTAGRYTSDEYFAEINRRKTSVSREAGNRVERSCSPEQTTRAVQSRLGQSAAGAFPFGAGRGIAPQGS